MKKYSCSSWKFNSHVFVLLLLASTPVWGFIQKKTRLSFAMCMLSLTFTSLLKRHKIIDFLCSTGMFPWAMLATTPLFCYPNWPRAIFRAVPRAMRLLTPDDESDDTQPSPHCLYPKEYVKSEEVCILCTQGICQV